MTSPKNVPSGKKSILRVPDLTYEIILGSEKTFKINLGVPDLTYQMSFGSEKTFKMNLGGADLTYSRRVFVDAKNVQN